jgi:hypothetical protein
LAATLLAALAAGSTAGALEARLTVREPVGVARKAEPVSAGVCFKPGEVTDLSKLALFGSDGRPVPCQFSPLVKLEGGSYQWVLADFQCDVAAGGTAEFVVREGAAAAPPKPVKVTEAGGKYTFDNGVLEFTVDAGKPAFEIFSELKAGGKVVLEGLGAEAMTCRDALEGNRLYRAGKVARAEFDYRGPMRTTLMLEGPYVDDGGKEWLAWRVRITCYAGSPLVRVEHSLRNSCAKYVRHVKVKDAHLRLGLKLGASAPQTAADHLAAGGVFVKHRLLSGYFSPTLHELGATDGKLSLAVVPRYEGKWNPRTHRGYNPNEGGTYNKGDTGSWWLYDCAYKIDEYWLNFAGGDANLARGLDSKLYALCPGEYYSECEALGFGRFGTVEDEAATYRKWGWKNVEAKKAALLAGKWMKPLPGYHVPYVLSHADSETDDAEGMLLMALRSGGRGYFDAGLAWARFYANNHVARIDFKPAGRRKYDRWKFAGHDVHIMTSHQSYSNGRTCGCHFYGAGAMDYYVLTGEKSLLLGSADIFRYVRNKWAKHVPGKSRVGSYGTRGFGRQFMAAIRYYEITRDPEVKKFIDHMAQLALKEPSYVKEEDYGFIDAPSSNGMHGKKQVTKYLAKLPRLQEYMKDKGLKWDEKSCTVTDAKGESWKVYDAAGTWEQTYVHQGMERYWRTTGRKDKDAEDYIVRFANYFRKFPWDDHCQQVGYIAWGLHFPEKGMCLGCQMGRWMPSHDKCPGPGAKHSGWYTRFGPDVAARAYAVSGKKEYLEQARMYWNRGSKRGYQRTAQSAPDDEVGTFATHVPPKDDSVLSTALMFYLVPRAK